MENKRWVKMHIYLTCLLTLFLSGCIPPYQPTTPTLPTILTQLPSSQIIVTQTLLPPTLTKQSTATVTGTVTPTPTLAHLPTLDSQGAQEQIQRLMQTNNNCSKNCVWGFRLGQSRYDKALQFLQSIGPIDREEIKGQKKDAWFSFDFREYAWGGIQLSGDKNIIQGIELYAGGLELPGSTGEDWLAFRPDMFLKGHGTPLRINVIMGTAPEGRVSYEMIWFYDQMSISYSGGRNQIIILPQHILHACPLVDHNIDQFLLVLGKSDRSIEDDGVDLSHATSLTIDEFVQIMTGDPTKACFDINYYQFIK